MIFKTINSSVDETRKTLALFNKDWNTYKRNWQNANGVFGKIGSVFTPANAITKSDIEAIKAYNSQIDSCVTSQTAFNRTMLNASPAAQNLVASYNGGKVSAQGMATAQNAAKASTIGLTIAQTALNTAIGMGIGLLISFIVNGIDKLVHANEEAIEKAEALRRKYEEFKSTNESNVTTLNGLRKEFEELSKGVSQYGDNVSLTTDQYERYKEIIQQIVGISPSLAEGYSTENGYIADKNGLLERAIELQEIEYRNELRKVTNLQNLKTSMAGYIAEYKDAFEGGWATEDMSATSTVKATDFSNALYEAFNYSERYNDGYSSEDLAREILKSLGIDNIDKEMEKFFNENGYYQPNWFFDEYVDEIAKNIDAVTNALSYENVGLEDDEFENRILTVKDCAQAYLDMKDSISMANESIQRNLQYIAEYADGYSNLTTEQQKFVNEFLKGFNIDDIVSRDWFGNLTYDEDKMKSVKRQITDFVEALSQDETTKTALTDLYAIPTDEQSISEFIEQFRNALEVIKVYCQENGIEIPIAITDSEQTINDLEAQYQRAVDFAKDKFDGYDPTAFFKEHSINTQEEIDKWQEIAQGARDATEAEKEYIQGSTLNENPISTFEDAWKNSFTSENESVKELANNLLELAEQGRLTKETFAQTDSTDYFKNLGISADEAILKINKLVDESKQLSSMASQISSISNALGTKRDDGFVSADTLAGFDAEVRGLDSWDRFQEVLGSTASSYEECQEAANALATEWVNDSNFLAQLTEENKEYYETQLQAMGVENYEEVIEYAQALNEAKEVLSQSSLTLGDATQDEIEALIAEGAYSELTANMILALYDAKIAEQAATIDTSADCEKLIALSGDTDRTSRSIQLLIQLMDIYNGLESGAYNGNRLLREEALAEVDRIKNELEALANGETQELPIEPTVKLGAKGSSSAKAAGTSAADAYLEAFEKELEELETLRDQGKITEKEYLDYLRKLYEKYFRDRKEYLDEFKKYENQYLQGMKSLYESALSGITSLLDKQISGYEDSKSAAVDSLEAERDARIEVLETQKEQYEAQIKLIDKQIEEKEKIIDGINEEIDAIRKANEERQRQIDLQKAQYELERMQNQKTILQYSSDKGMHYVTDTSGTRDAKDAVDDAQTEITIANKEKEIDLVEKEIDLLEERKDLINEQIDLLDAQIDQINEQYDKLITDTEKYWDDLIKGMEDYKSRWEELAEIEEQAKIVETLRSLGIETGDILNMSEEAFAKFKDEYISILADIYSGNDSMLSALSDTTGQSVEQMGSYITATQGYIDSLSGIGESLNPVAEAIGNVDENMSSLSSAVSDVNTNLTETASTTNEVAASVGSIAECLDQIPDSQNMTNLSGAFDALAGSIGKVVQALGLDSEADINTLLQTISELNTVTLGNEDEGIIGQFTLLKNAVTDVVNTIGSSGEQTVGSLMQAISELNTITLGENIITQFNNLKTAIDSVASVIGGGSGPSDGESPGSNAGYGEDGDRGSNGEGGGGNSLTDAITSLGDATGKVIGAPGSKNNKTIIGQFGSLETAVNDVTAAIGGGDPESGESQGEEGSDNLSDSITNLGTTTKETLGEPDGEGVIGRFGKFRDVIGEADEHVQGIFSGLDDINNTTVECTIKIKIEGDSFPTYASGTALGAMNLESAEYKAKYKGNAHVSGTANVTGNWGVRKPGKSLVGELGQEIWIHSANGTFETVGDNGPEWINTAKGDLIFNHLQTKELLDKGNIVKTGKAYANGNIQYSDGTVIRTNGEVLEPLQPGNKMYDMFRKFNTYMESIDNNVEKFTSNSIYERNRQMHEAVNQIMNSNVVNNRNVQPNINVGGITITCPGITSKDVAKQVGIELNHMFNGFSLYTDQMSRIR